MRQPLYTVLLTGKYFDNFRLLSYLKIWLKRNTDPQTSKLRNLYNENAILRSQPSKLDSCQCCQFKQVEVTSLVTASERCRPEVNCSSPICRTNQIPNVNLFLVCFMFVAERWSGRTFGNIDKSTDRYCSLNNIKIIIKKKLIEPVISKRAQVYEVRLTGVTKMSCTVVPFSYKFWKLESVWK